MSLLGINRGFETMIPRHKEEEQTKVLFTHRLKFKVLRKEFSFLIEVKSGE